jgi:hypothetical protein
MNEWIDINLEKPKDKQKVLIKGKFPGCFICNFYKTTKNGFVFSMRRSKNLVFEFYGVTHWKHENNE